MSNKKKIRMLLVIDMQNDFIDGSLGSEGAQSIVPNVVEKIKNFDGDLIILTRDTHFDDYLKTNEGKKLPVKHCIYGTYGWEICDEVAFAIQDWINQHDVCDEDVMVIDKPTFASMHPVHVDRNDLISVLNNICSIKHTDLDIEMVGLDTDICVVSNALMLKGWFYDCAEITVDSKCCAGVTPESHQAALTVMKNCQINII